MVRVSRSSGFTMRPSRALVSLIMCSRGVRVCGGFEGVDARAGEGLGGLWILRSRRLMDFWVSKVCEFFGLEGL